MTFTVVALLIALAALGVPLFVVLGAGSLYAAHSAGLDPAVLVAEMMRLASSPNLMAIPLFTLAGEREKRDGHEVGRGGQAHHLRHEDRRIEPRGVRGVQTAGAEHDKQRDTQCRKSDKQCNDGECHELRFGERGPIAKRIANWAVRRKKLNGMIAPSAATHFSAAAA